MKTRGNVKSFNFYSWFVQKMKEVFSMTRSPTPFIHQFWITGQTKSVWISSTVDPIEFSKKGMLKTNLQFNFSLRFKNWMKVQNLNNVICWNTTNLNKTVTANISRDKRNCKDNTDQAALCPNDLEPSMHSKLNTMSRGVWEIEPLCDCILQYTIL